MKATEPVQDRQVVWISCPDETGLIHKITGALFRLGANIVQTGEFVDRKAQQFFMRIEFVKAGPGSIAEGSVENELRSMLPASPTTVVELRRNHRRKLVLLATRESHCLGDLLLRHQAGELKADVLGVVSQYDSLHDLVRRFEIPFHCVPVGDLSREAHEAKLLQVIDGFRPDYVVLAKYMRVLTPGFVARFPNRILNIHHSFLPAFVGASPYQQAYERGVKIIGATSHFVNEDLDEGPIITQAVLPVTHALDAPEMARQGRDVERVALAQALKLVLEDRVLVHGKRTIIFE